MKSLQHSCSSVLTNCSRIMWIKHFLATWHICSVCWTLFYQLQNFAVFKLSEKSFCVNVTEPPRTSNNSEHLRRCVMENQDGRWVWRKAVTSSLVCFLWLFERKTYKTPFLFPARMFLIWYTYILMYWPELTVCTYVLEYNRGLNLHNVWPNNPADVTRLHSDLSSIYRLSRETTLPL